MLAITRTLLGASAHGNHRLGELMFKMEDICIYACVSHNTHACIIMKILFRNS